MKAELMTEIADIEMEGHLIDSQMLTRVLDKIMDMEESLRSKPSG